MLWPVTASPRSCSLASVATKPGPCSRVTNWGPNPVAAMAESARRQAEAFAATSPNQSVPHPNGDILANAFLRFRLVDLVVHAWDLLRAAGLDETLDPAVVSAL